MRRTAVMSITSKILARLPKILTPIVILCGKSFLSLHSQNILRWKLSNGDNTLRINYSLNRDSIVFDLGGFEGDWSANIYNKYQCNIYIFEPVKEYVENIENRFQGLNKIHIFPYGLSDKTKTIYLHMLDNATSEFGTSQELIKARLVNIKNFMTKYNLKNIDLIKINIEGGEYDLLEYVLKENLVKKFRNIQVQFHSFVPDANLRANRIQKNLKKTHTLLYRFPFVWENWTLKDL